MLEQVLKNQIVIMQALEDLHNKSFELGINMKLLIELDTRKNETLNLLTQAED